MNIDDIIEGVLKAEGGSRSQCCDRLYDALTTLNASMQRLVRQPLSLTVVNERQAVSVDIDKYSHSSVSRLFLRGGPTAIARLVVPINVNSIQRRSDRSRPHVSQKLRKVSSPCLAHSDAPTSIKRIFGIVRVLASAFRVVPSPQFRGRCSVLGMAMFDGSRSRHIPPMASATYSSAYSHRIKVRGDYCSTSAGKLPNRASAIVRHSPQPSQASE